MNDAVQPTQAPAQMPLTSGVRFSIKVLAFLGMCSALYYARSFFLPITLAMIFSLTLSPVVNAARRYRIPASLTAALLVSSLGLALVAGTLTLANPFAELISDAPNIGQELQEKLKVLREPVESINNVEKEVEKLTSDKDPGTTQEVVIKQPALLARAADDVIALIATAVLVLTLSFFLLTARDMFFRKVVRVMPKLSDKKRALLVATEIERDVSKYLLTVSLINGGMGAAIGCAMWVLGLPNPFLWGVLAAVLNFLPYVGAIIGIGALAGVAIITFDSLATALLAPGAYLLVTLIEGQFVTPLVLGRRFSLNTVVIFISIAFWGFMWGPFGVFIALPLLIVLKVFCDRVDSLASLGEFLSGEDIESLDDDEEPPTPGEVLSALENGGSGSQETA